MTTSRLTNAEGIELVKAARAEHDKQRALCVAEMTMRGKEGQLWTYGQCAAWPAYQNAIHQLDRARERAGV